MYFCSPTELVCNTKHACLALGVKNEEKNSDKKLMKNSFLHFLGGLMQSLFTLPFNLSLSLPPSLFLYVSSLPFSVHLCFSLSSSNLPLSISLSISPSLHIYSNSGVKLHNTLRYAKLLNLSQTKFDQNVCL